MALHNMQCPKCGYVTTNYDGRKTWKCLQCGNEIVLQEDNYNTSFNVNSDALYDLDVHNTKPFTAKSSQVIVGHTSRNIFNGILCIFMGLPAALEGFVMAIWSLVSGTYECILPLLGLCLAGAFLMWKGISEFTQKVKPIYDTMVVGYSFCPHCKNIYGTYYENYYRDLAWNEGLTHCHACGKQFVISNGVSYQIQK